MYYLNSIPLSQVRADFHDDCTPLGAQDERLPFFVFSLFLALVVPGWACMIPVPPIGAFFFHITKILRTHRLFCT